jgi:hypothetical protein
MAHLMLSSPADRGITHAIFSTFNVAGQAPLEVLIGIDRYCQVIPTETLPQ